MSSRKILAALLLAASVSLVAGCGGGSETSGTAADGAGASAPGAGSVTVVKDEAHWTMPTDPYDTGTLSDLEAQALDVLRKPCMIKAGYKDFTVRFDASAPQAPDLAANGMTRIFNEDVAARYGYRMAPNPRDLLAAEVQAAGGSLWANQPQEFWDALKKCDDAADKELGTTAQPDDNATAMSGQFNRLMVDTKAEALVTAAGKWRDCMAPLGIVDLPQRPWEPGAFPPESLVQKWGWDTTGQASAEEIQVASADAACRRSSGWFDALYDAEWNLKQDFVSKHQAELGKLRESIEAKRARYQAIIAKGTA